MKIVYKFGPHAGEISHCPRSQEIEVLLKAGIIEELPLTDVEKAEAVQNHGHTIVPHFATPQWSVVNSPYTGKLLIQRRYGHETMLFDGPPSQRDWPDCPKEVVERFTAVQKQEVLARENAQRDRDRAVQSVQTGKF